MEQLQHLTSRSQLAVAGGGTDRLLLSVEVKQTSVTQALGIQRDGWTGKEKKTFIQPRFKLCPTCGLFTRWTDILSGVPGYKVMGTGT